MNEMIDNMSGICKNCKYIGINEQIKRFICKANDETIVMMGITLNCGTFQYEENRNKAKEPHNL